MSNLEIGYKGRQVIMPKILADNLEIPPPDVLTIREDIQGTDWTIVSWYLEEARSLDDYYANHPGQKRH